MKVEPPKTIEDFEKTLDTILELQSNPFCYHSMFMSLEKGKRKVEHEIAKLKSKL